ncbi:hypothetical protein Tco_0541217 [Tanacetum coccineum]
MSIFARSFLVDLNRVTWSDLGLEALDEIKYAFDIAIRFTNDISLIKLKVAFYAINARRLPVALLVYMLVRPPIVLSIEDKLDYLEHPIPPAHVLAQACQQVAPEALAAHTAWVKGSKEIAELMIMTMEPDIQRNLENLSAYDMLQELKTLFAQQAEQELLQTVRDFYSCKQEKEQSGSSYVLKMKSYINNLERLGHPVSLNLGVSLILISLRKEFDSFVKNYNMHSMRKTVNELHAMLKLHEQTLTKKDPTLLAIRASKVQKKNNKQKKPQSLEEELPSASRTCRSRDRFFLLSYVYNNAEEHALGDLDEPTNYKAALLNTESDKWLNDMNVEMQSMKDNKFLDLVELLPPNGKTVSSKWLFKKKTDMDGDVHTFKARLVAKGYTQTPWD